MALNNAKQIVAEDRRHQAIQLKMGGATTEQIAAQLGVSGTLGHIYIRKRLREVRQDDGVAVQEEYNLQRARYDRLLLRWWNQALGPDTETAERATGVCLKILRQIDYIGGLVPEKSLIQLQQNVQINNGGITFAELAKEASIGAGNGSEN